MAQRVPVQTFPYKEDPLIRKMRVQAWFWAVRHTSGLSTHELERLFREDTGRQINRSCIWNKYRRGEVVPRSGFYECGAVKLVERVEARYPGTAGLLNSPIWRLADPAPMEMCEIRGIYEGLPNPIRDLFIARDSGAWGKFWRRDVNQKQVYDILYRIRDTNSLTAALALVKESEAIQSQKLFMNRIEATMHLVEMLKSQSKSTKKPSPLVDCGLFEYLRESWISGFR